MAQRLSFAGVMAGLQAGEAAPAEQVFRQYADRLVGLARQRLGRQMRQKVDPEDVVQSVFRSFFFRQRKGEFQLDDWDGLWRMLVVITLRKCGHQVRHFMAERRNLQREQIPQRRVNESDGDWQPVAHGPSPSEVLRFIETVEELMRDFDPRERQILELILQGYTVVEVSTQVGRSERTVHRVMARVRQRLQRMQAQDHE